MLWLQLALGLLTVPLSAFHMDGVLFETLTSYVRGVVTLNGESAALMSDVPLPYKLHIRAPRRRGVYDRGGFCRRCGSRICRTCRR